MPPTRTGADDDRYAGEVRELLQGAVDTHLHTSPDVVERSVTDAEAARQAAHAGMRAIVIKSHHAVTSDRAAIAARAVGNRIAVEGYASFLSELLELGVPEADRRRASATNATQLLGLTP